MALSGKVFVCTSSWSCLPFTSINNADLLWRYRNASEQAELADVTPSHPVKEPQQNIATDDKGHNAKSVNKNGHTNKELKKTTTGKTNTGRPTTKSKNSDDDENLSTAHDSGRVNENQSKVKYQYINIDNENENAHIKCTTDTIADGVQIDQTRNKQPIASDIDKDTHALENNDGNKQKSRSCALF